jgi:hypothetical protein
VHHTGITLLAAPAEGLFTASQLASRVLHARAAALQAQLPFPPHGPAPPAPACAGPRPHSPTAPPPLPLLLALQAHPSASSVLIYSTVSEQDHANQASTSLGYEAYSDYRCSALPTCQPDTCNLQPGCPALPQASCRVAVPTVATAGGAQAQPCSRTSSGGLAGSRPLVSHSSSQPPQRRAAGAPAC